MTRSVHEEDTYVTAHVGLVVNRGASDCQRTGRPGQTQPAAIATTQLSSLWLEPTAPQETPPMVGKTWGVHHAHPEARTLDLPQGDQEFYHSAKQSFVINTYECNNHIMSTVARATYIFLDDTASQSKPKKYKNYDNYLKMLKTFIPAKTNESFHEIDQIPGHSSHRPRIRRAAPIPQSSTSAKSNKHHGMTFS
ncbi:hypothetical protein LXL04_030775 [Taraxacum kok-saghyz]